MYSTTERGMQRENNTYTITHISASLRHSQPLARSWRVILPRRAQQYIILLLSFSLYLDCCHGYCRTHRLNGSRCAGQSGPTYPCTDIKSEQVSIGVRLLLLHAVSPDPCARGSFLSVCPCVSIDSQSTPVKFLLVRNFYWIIVLGLLFQARVVLCAVA